MADIAYRRLEEMIVRLELAPGLVISELSLCDRLDLGRTPIHEALHRLAREGLIVVMPRRGIAVSDINIGKQIKLLELRRVLEQLMSSTAAQRSDEAQRATFRRIAHDMRLVVKRNDDRAFLKLDQELNDLLASACRNEYARAAIGLTSGLSRRFWYCHYRENADLPLAAQRHADLADAIADGDPAAAANASKKLLDYIESFTKASAGWPNS
jgi:DNA-binding GntR family transcriptional regulator